MFMDQNSIKVENVYAKVSSKRNVVLIITDDQDIELGSMNYMPKVSKLLKEKGTEFRSGFVSTPICCPSRSSILTGMYVHNHNVHTNNHNCSGEEWSNHVPPGWDYWIGLVKNSKFYNYTVNLNGNRVKYGAEYEKDYFTDLVTNHSVKFIMDHFSTHNDKPFFIVISYPAPHGPEDPAPQYAELFEDIDSHRTDSWNYAPNPDKQWLLQRTGKMEPVHVAFTDLLHRRRMQTLQSVDDGVHLIFSTLRDHNYLSSTYAFYTSDHGYHLGQFGLIKGKNMPYEFDIRVPFFIRGPGVMKKFSVREPVLNIDIAPTLISIAGGSVPSYMDGRNLLELLALKKAVSHGKNVSSSSLTPWRDTILIERGKMPKLRKIRDRWLNQKERYGKEMRLNDACSKPEWQHPCTGSQCNTVMFSVSNEHLRCGDVQQFTFRRHEEFNLRPAVEINDNLRRRKEKGNLTNPDRAACSVQQMNCFLHSIDHWKTPPLWPDEYGQFCFCQNSNNNTYWCLRTINDIENFLYCEFVTEFVSYYDLNDDPHQLHNTVYSLEMNTLEQLSERLRLLRECQGSECERFSSSIWEQHVMQATTATTTTATLQS
ncbi:unnamed protein product [Angiostrongylus costaricensis]|uniref:Sulfatase domain-containing protein n=1 Tax=Angiostrongylus costaricensis TaxID=334426 RepID=A0A158PDC0_ANGCS|nr:unnamed protein product [Angiostrongylus costaricensis]